MVIDALRARGEDVEEVLVSTLGDRRTDVAIHTLSSGAGSASGVFAAEIQAAVLQGNADIAVHSAKDLASRDVEGLEVLAVLERADSADVLVGSTLDDLRPGAVVATGSVRRQAQLAWFRPDLTFTELRGNIGTRLDAAAAAGTGAAVVAAAALDRLGMGARAAQRLDPDLVVPQAGQGAVAVECRTGDTRARRALARLDHAPSHRRVAAERSFLAALGAGCDWPVAAHAVLDGGRIRLRATVAALGGRMLLTDTVTGTDPGEVGRAAADRLLACGGRWVLEGCSTRGPDG